MLSRRKFLTVILPGLAVSSVGFLYGSASAGSCPLSNEGYCVGPCSAFRDPNGDNICDRLPLILNGEVVAEVGPRSEAVDATATPTAMPPTAAPKAQGQPTQLSTQRANSSPTPLPSATSTRTAPRVACPFGLVNDRYPGRCRRYLDRNGNGICDLSEPQG